MLLFGSRHVGGKPIYQSTQDYPTTGSRMLLILLSPHARLPPGNVTFTMDAASLRSGTKMSSP
jgi:hypothetical protein